MAKKEGLLSNMVWKFAERISAQLVTFFVSIILARLLEPSHYGIIAIVTIFITLANVFVSDGFGSALIQKKNADALDFSSVLGFNVVFSVLLYLILFFAAPLIADFYGEGYEIVTPVLRVLGLRLIFSGINSVQQAYISRKMMFRKFFWSTLIGTIVSAFVGISMAYMNYGVWSLVFQYLTNTTINTLILTILINKIPPLKFSFNRIKGLVKFGANVLGTKLIITLFQELRALIIGKLYTSADLAYYEKGKQMPNLIVTNIDSSISAVLFPKMSNEQDKVSKVKATTRSSVRFSSYLMSPIMLGLAAVAKPFVSLVLTDKWLPCVPLMQLFCLFYLFQPIHTANIQAFKAVGRSDICLKLEIFRDSIQLIVLVAVMQISVTAIVVSMAIMSTLFVFVNAWPNIKLLGYSIKEQLADIIPSIIMAGIMALSVFSIGLIPINNLPKLIIQVLSGTVIYLLLSILTKNSVFLYFYNFLISKIKH